MNIEKECSNTISDAVQTVFRKELYRRVDGLVENNALLWRLRFDLYARACDDAGFCVDDKVRTVGFETK
jgi:hypothetical protein